jgi:hypothetical protein
MANRRNQPMHTSQARSDVYARLDEELGFPRRQVSWHLEKGVSISIIVVLLAQAASGVWFASKMTAQVEQNTNDISAIKTDEKEREKQRAEVIANLSAMNQNLKDIREIIWQGASRASTQLIMPSGTNGGPPQVIMQQAAPAPSNSSDRLSMPGSN